ncbi:hypothetical protein QTP88_026339 [Uroleucon formosanum]
MINLTHIYNAILGTEYVPKQWKRAQIIMLLKPGKPPEHEKKYCCGVFLDVAQAFDKVWHKGLHTKLREQLPHTWYALIESYLTKRQFRVIHDEKRTDWKNISVGVPQGSVLGLLLYLLYTADIPTTNFSMTAMFANDTVILATDEDQQTRTYQLQRVFKNVSDWFKHSVHLSFLNMENEQYKINKLKDASNWDVWKFQIKVFMNAAEIFDVITGKSKKPIPTKIGNEIEDEARKRHSVDFSI